MTLEETINPKSDAVVITGIAGRFPESADVHEFRDNLFNKVDMVNDDPRRWAPSHAEIPQRTGKVKEIKKFDAGFFGIHQRQARIMDPMLRMIIENTFEAILDAGFNPKELQGTNTGVFVGACFSESEKTSFYENLDPEKYGVTGCTRSMIAKRLSYWFQFQGKSFVTDTACSSSLFALEHACRAIKDGSCDTAIVCGCSLCMHPMVSLQFARLGVLSVDGACKSFDNSANGYARSEAISVIVLQRYEAARRVYAEIVHSKTNCDGYKELGITYPSGSIQKILLEDFYRDCKIKANELTYVEAHGTGTKVGDPEELGTLDEIFCKDRNRPMLIGSVKSNIGHNEPVSGLCSVIKVILAFETGFIPPNIHYKSPRKGVEALESGRLKVVSEKTPLPDDKGLIGVNSFGFGGANSHVLFRWNQKAKVACTDHLPRLVCLSGRTSEAIRYFLEQIQGQIQGQNRLDVEYINLLHKIFAHNIPGHFYRGYTILSQFGTLQTSYKKYNEDMKPLLVIFGNLNDWLHYAKQLYHLAQFGAHVKKVHNILLARKLKLENVHDILDVNLCPPELVAVILSTGIVTILKQIGIKVSNFTTINKLGSITIDYASERISLEEAILMSLNQNQEGPVPVPKFKTKNYTILAIGNIPHFRSAHRVYPLITKKHDDSIRGLLDGLGRLYQSGHNFDLENLYPKVHYPVGRGTPMISPLVRWDHSKDWFTMVYKQEDKMKSGQRAVEPSLKDDEWSFLKGHIIDGRTLFPATGYLCLIWETLARFMGRLQTEMKVVFEEVKFLRAFTVSNMNDATLTIRIQKGSGYFEVFEGGSSVVTGRIYENENLEDDWCSLPTPPDYLKTSHHLIEKDIYKELRLRGYNYKGDFRMLKSSTLDASHSKVQWTSNWISAMDAMLQIHILQEDTRCLYIPTRIGKLSIDTNKHISMTKALTETSPYLSMYFYQDLNIVRLGGIELRGLWANSIAQRKQADPVLESYKFTPNVNLEAVPVALAVRLLVQMILENESVLHFKSAEIIDQDSTQILSRYVQKALGDQPLVKANLNVFTSEPLDLDSSITVSEKPTGDSDFILAIGRNLCGSQEMTSFVKNNLLPKGFLLSIDNQIGEDTKEYTHLACVAVVEDNQFLNLLRRKNLTVKKQMAIEISDGFDWLEELQQALLQSNNQIILWSRDPNSGILGLTNCLRREPNNSDRVACLWLLEDSLSSTQFDLKNYFTQLNRSLPINILKGTTWGTYRHFPLDQSNLVQCEHAYVNVGVRGDLLTLSWFQGPLNSCSILDPEEVLVHVYYAAINFRDIMTATGRIQPDVVTRNRLEQDCVQGFEFCGKTNAGRRVMGMRTRNAMATLVPGDVNLLWTVPDSWTMEEAVTIPAVYGTVVYGLIQRANIQVGESVLIHSGTGGVGHAAINLCTQYQCRIFVTVGTEEKRNYIRSKFPQIEPKNIGNSRDLSFLSMVLKETNGRGVDLILNSLADEKLQASVKCLARGGRFLEIGKYDLAADSPLSLDLVKLEASYHGVMLDALFDADPIVKRGIKDLISLGIEQGYIKTLPTTCFNSNELEEAFRYMATGKHMGKVVVKVRDSDFEDRVPKGQLFPAIPRFHCDPDKVYLINGGLGGFGLELCDWLVVRGARKLWINSRRGITTSYQRLRIKIWKSYGVTLKISCENFADQAETSKVLKECQEWAAISAIFNLAVILKDALCENQTKENFAAVCDPKSVATSNLDLLSRTLCPNLDYFVVFSSVSCGRGNAGQTNYGLANSIMERICEDRRRSKLPAVAIQWGAIGDVGLVADMQEENTELVIGGTLQQKIASCLHTLDQFLTNSDSSDSPIVASMVVAEKKIGSGGANNIVDAVVNILGLRDLKTVSLHSTFPELGMDSMMAVEIKQTLEREFDVFLSPQDIRGMTFARMQEIAVQKNGESLEDERQSEDMPVNVRTLLRFIAKEEDADIPLIRMTSLQEEPRVFLVPGIEGMATLFDPFVKTLQAPSACLQFCYSKPEETIEDMARTLLPILLCSLKSRKQFLLVAHSFGSSVAMEMVAQLESQGYLGTLVVLDGAPLLMKSLIVNQMDVSSEEGFQTSLLCNLMSVYLPFEIIANYKNKLLQFESYEERMDYAMGVAPKKVPHSLEYMRKVCTAAYKRAKAMYNYEPSFKKLHSRIVLCRPENSSLVHAKDDYDLSAVVGKQVEVKFFQGNHVSMLDNPKLTEYIDDIARQVFDSANSMDGEFNSSLEDDPKKPGIILQAFHEQCFNEEKFL